MKKKLNHYAHASTEDKEADEEPLNMQQQEWDREWSQVREDSVTGAKSERES